MRKKLTLLYIPLLLVPLIAFALISNHLFTQAIINRSLSSMVDHAKIMASQVDAKIKAANNCATYLSLDIDQLYTATPKDPNAQESLRYETLLGNALSYARLIYPDLHSIAFIDTKGKIYTTHAQMVLADPKEEATAYMDPLFASAGNRVWFPVQKRTWLNVSPNSPVLTLGKKIWHTQTGKTIGYLLINLAPEKLSEGFQQDLATYHLVAKDTLVFPKDDQAVASLVAQRMASNNTLLEENLLMVKVPLTQLDLSIIGYGDLKAHTPDLQQGTTLLVLAALMTLLVLMLFTWFSQAFIVTPIKTLHTGVEAISNGHFDNRLPESTSDELGLLANHINQMTERIQALMLKETQMAHRRRTLELERLQEQIKPHFLYNTLDIIRKLIDLGELRRAKRATAKLAAFYKRSLAEGSEDLSLAEEVQLVEDYMAIQNIRYDDAFELQVQVPHQYLHLPIPKLTLQPLIENAIYHGLKLTTNRGLIKITAQATEDQMLCIAIQDNGVGVSDEKLQALNALDRTTGFGISSVAERLQLYYGPLAQMTFSHNPDCENGQGLYVALFIPLNHNHQSSGATYD